jgi:hypothetical protein
MHGVTHIKNAHQNYFDVFINVVISVIKSNTFVIQHTIVFGNIIQERQNANVNRNNKMRKNKNGDGGGD